MKFLTVQQMVALDAYQALHLSGGRLTSEQLLPLVNADSVTFLQAILGKLKKAGFVGTLKGPVKGGYYIRKESLDRPLTDFLAVFKSVIYDDIERSEQLASERVRERLRFAIEVPRLREIVDVKRDLISGPDLPPSL